MKYSITACVVISLFATLAHAEDPWTPSPLCPYPSEELTRSPYEGDCTRFWECFEGARYIMTCPEGLEYSDEEKACDRPEVAHCDKDATVTYPTYPHTQDPNVTATTPFSPDPMCPFPSEIITFYPYPLNCTQYWECFEGKKYLMDCPVNLYWNIDYNYCDYIENVDCNKNYASTTPKPDTTPNGPVTTQSPGPTDVWTPDPLCPYPSEEVVFFPYLLNCSQYWECYEGNKYLMSCPSGLFWNDVLNSCDYLRNVDCNRTPTTSTTPLPTNATEASPSTTTLFPTTPTSPPTTTPATLCQNTPDGTYFTDPTDCGSYYECVGGKGICMHCPGNLLWNEDLLTCDFPENVKC